MRTKSIAVLSIALAMVGLPAAQTVASADSWSVFEATASDQVLAVGGVTTLRFARAAPGASIAVTGGMKTTLRADGSGFASITFRPAKPGIAKFTGTYSIKVGKKLTKYSATTQVYVPKVAGSTTIKAGNNGKFTVKYCPPGANVSVEMSDGRTLRGLADKTGAATLTSTFAATGRTSYAVAVAGTAVDSGSINVVAPSSGGGGKDSYCMAMDVCPPFTCSGLECPVIDPLP